MQTRKQLSVRTKLFVFLCAVSLIPMLLSSRVLTALGSRSSQALRELQVNEGLERASRTLHLTQTRLEEGTRAVADWEELSGYLAQPQPNWPRENLQGWVPMSYKLDYLMLCDTLAKPLYEWYSSITTSSLPIDTLLALTQHQKSGLVSTPQELFLIARQDISTKTGKIGTLVFGRCLTQNLLLEINTDADQDLLLYYGGRLLATTDTTNTLARIDPAEIFPNLVPRDGTYLYYMDGHDQILGFQALKNIQGLEIATLGWTCTKTPAGFLQKAINKMLIFFGLPLLLLILAAALVLGLWIERPIRNLSKTMERVTQTGDLSCRVPVMGGGEISTISKSFNQMLEQLARQRDELMTFRTMILAMKEGVLIENAAHQVIYMNPRMEEMLGRQWAEAEASNEPLMLAEKITLKRQITQDARGFSTEEVEWTDPLGNRVQALRTSGRLEEPLGKVTGILSTFVDVTERNELELELIQASRMAFLGVYSQGIIHNLNGPLNTILGFSSLQCRNEPAAEIPQRIRRDAQRMADLISSLGRRWHRTGASSIEPLDLNEILREELRFLEADLFFKHNVEKKIELDPALPLIHGVYGDFSHAFLNLLINAIEALSESANHQLTVRTRQVGSEILVEIEDTGIGIEAEHLSRIFLPFFSTKNRDRKDGIPSGAGLGLPIARKILEPYKVHFEIRSEVRQGTTMTLHIPCENNQVSSPALAENYEMQPC